MGMSDKMWRPVPQGYSYEVELPSPNENEPPRKFRLTIPSPTSMLRQPWLTVVDYYGRASIPLPDNIRLCELVEVDAPAAVTIPSKQVWQPVEDGEYPLGDVTQNCNEDCIRITSVGHNCILSITDCGDGGHDVYLGKKYRLCQLVESDAPAAMPSDHEATIKQALHWMRDDSRQIRLAYGRDFHDDAMARIDAALAWLDATADAQPRQE